MHADPMTLIFVSIVFSLILVSFIMQKMKQPVVIAYLLVGIFLGPSGIGLVTDQVSLARVGELGVILLLFFVGMEVSPQKLASNWLIAGIGTLVQTFLTVLLVIVPSYIFSWSWAETILIGFVISLSSTAVVIKLLQDWAEVDTRVGQNVLGILIVQDLLIVPMLIILAMFKGNTNYYLLTLKTLFGISIILFGTYVLMKSKIHIPVIKRIARDHESQVFVSLLICFGSALVTSMLGLSSAFGAFLGGMIVATTKETAWVHHNLGPLKTIFMALFFISIGMLVDINYVLKYFFQTFFLVFSVLSINTVLNAVILKTLGESWFDSLYAASYLAQIGEFAFVLTSIGYTSNLIDNSHYKILLSVIVISLMLSPMWISLCKNIATRWWGIDAKPA
jgi:CPA2 family monovalent cation:H+ antiporter-2